jgi:hypothetical protein
MNKTVFALKKPGDRFRIYLHFKQRIIRHIHVVQDETDNDAWRLKGIYGAQEYIENGVNLGFPDYVSAYYINEQIAHTRRS